MDDMFPVVALRADAIREGDSILHNDRHLIVWGHPVEEGDVVLYTHVTPFSTEFPEPIRLHPGNPVWVSEYDAKVTGRWPL